MKQIILDLVLKHPQGGTDMKRIMVDASVTLGGLSDAAAEALKAQHDLVGWPVLAVRYDTRAQ